MPSWHLTHPEITSTTTLIRGNLISWEIIHHSVDSKGWCCDARLKKCGNWHPEKRELFKRHWLLLPTANPGLTLHLNLSVRGRIANVIKNVQNKGHRTKYIVTSPAKRLQNTPGKCEIKNSLSYQWLRSSWVSAMSANHIKPGGRKNNTNWHKKK